MFKSSLVVAARELFCCQITPPFVNNLRCLLLRGPASSGKHRIVVILSENGRRCAKYYCSGQVGGSPASVLLALVMHDLGFCGFASSQAVLFGLQMPSDVPRTGIFCAFGKKKRQHAAAGPNEGCRKHNMPQAKQTCTLPTTLNASRQSVSKRGV